MPCDRPTYKSKKQAIRHGFVQYGRKQAGARKFQVYKVKGGYNVTKK